MCSLKLPVTVIEVIDKYRKNCLCRGKEFNQKKYNLAAWDLVRRPKSKGVFGVVNLVVQNNALLLKQLDKFYRKADVQWVSLIWHKYNQIVIPHLAREKGSFWWKDILRLHVLYRGVAVYLPSRGDTVAFWEDVIDGNLQSDTFPNLAGYAKDPKASLWKLRNEGNLINCFNIPMSRAAYNEFLLLQQYIDSLSSPDRCENDSWRFIWGHQVYSSSKYYQYQFKNLTPSRVLLWVWKSNCIPTIKFFACFF
jgi:hypothetical protein